MGTSRTVRSFYGLRRLFLLALLGSGSPLFAQGGDSILYPSWGLALGGYFSAADANLRFDVTNSSTGTTIGTDIDFENVDKRLEKRLFVVRSGLRTA
jgi:hypothetical protein